MRVANKSVRKYLFFKALCLKHSYRFLRRVYGVCATSSIVLVFSTTMLRSELSPRTLIVTIVMIIGYLVVERQIHDLGNFDSKGLFPLCDFYTISR